MASKRSIKKDLNNMVFDVVDECFMAMMAEGSVAEKAEKLIDEAAEFQDVMLVKINSSKSKADFKAVRNDLEKAAIDFVNKLNALV